MKSHFISLVAHKLHAPVAAIKGYLDIIIAKAAGDEPEQYENMIQRSSERAGGLLELIKSIDMSRLDSKKVVRNIQAVNVNKVIENNLEFFKIEFEKKNISVVTDMPDGQSIIHVDPEEFNGIIVNLISNSIKYNFRMER